MAIQYDELTQGLIKKTVKVSVPSEDFTWGQDVLFAGEDGTDQDYFNAQDQIGQVVIPEEAVKGLDPTRVNYGIGFDLRKIEGQYFFPEDSVDLSSAKNRLFEEPLDQPWSTAKRCVAITAKKRDAMAQGFRAAKEKLAFDCALNGKFTTKSGGEQVFPMSSSLLNLSGANLLTKPFETINAAAKVLFEKGVIVKRLVLNPTDASNLASSAAWQTMLDKKRVEVGAVDPQTVDARGMAKIGTIKGIICGEVTVYAYAGFYRTGATTTVNYIPQGKALLLPEGNIGFMGYTGILQKNGDVQDKVSAKELFLVYGESKGNLVTTKIQGQTAPAAILNGIDHYGVLTNIPTA